MTKARLVVTLGSITSVADPIRSRRTALPCRSAPGDAPRRGTAGCAAPERNWTFFGRAMSPGPADYRQSYGS